MEARAIQRTVRQSARKMRLVIDQIRGQAVPQAYAILRFSKKLAAKQIQGAQVGGGERRAARAAREHGARRGPAARQVRGRERRADPQAVHPGGDGPRHAHQEAHQPRRDPRGGGSRVPGAKGHACKRRGESGGHSPARQGRGGERQASQGQEGGRQVQDEEKKKVNKWARRHTPTGSGSESSSRGARATTRVTTSPSS